MKYLSNNKVLFGIVFVVMLMFAVPASAQTNEDMCKNQAEFAASIMNARQQGASIMSIMQNLEGINDQGTKRVLQIIANMAYERPKFNSQQYQQEAVTEFSNYIYIACNKAMANKDSK